MKQNDEKLMQFIAWVKENKAPDLSIEETAQQIQSMSNDEKGREMLQSLVQEYQESTSGETALFKKGGKLNQLVEKKKMAKAERGVKLKYFKGA